MAFTDYSDRVRFGIVLAVLAAFSIVAGQLVLSLPLGDLYLFLIPFVVLFVGGLVWDRIYLHDRAI